MKSSLFVVFWAMALLVREASADTFTYDVSFNVNAIAITGTILTDCNSCSLGVSDILSWSFQGSDGNSIRSSDTNAFYELGNNTTTALLVGVVSIVALTLAAVSESSAQDNLSDQTVCRRGLSTERTAWIKDSFYAEEAARRGLTVDGCRQLVVQQPISPPTNQLAATANGTGNTNLITQTDLLVCSYALNDARSGWDAQVPKYVAEAARRGLSISDCNKTLARLAAPSTPNPPPTTTTESPTEPEEEADLDDGGAWTDQHAFLEAATYFITGLDVDARNGDVVSDSQIKLGRYPLVIYRQSECAVRFRATTKPYVIWQIDFCEITHWRERRLQFGHSVVSWYGKRGGWCAYKGHADKDENYTGYISPASSDSRCSLDGPMDVVPQYYTAYSDNCGINDLNLLNADGTFVDGKHKSAFDRSFCNTRRDTGRMIDSFKYITTLLTGKPY